MENNVERNKDADADSDAELVSPEVQQVIARCVAVWRQSAARDLDHLTVCAGRRVCACNLASARPDFLDAMLYHCLCCPT